MKQRMFLSALFKMKNLAIFIGSGVFLYGTGQTFPHLLPDFINTYQQVIGPAAAVAIYLFFVARTLLSKEFHENFNRKEKVRQIRELNYTCTKLASEAKKHTNSTYYQKLRKVMEDKNDIMNSFFKGEHSYLKEKIVEQTLNLMVSYLKLLTNFCMRSKELNGMDLGAIANRINMNSRKLSFAKDPGASEDIKKVIEMDEKLIHRLKEEKNDLERISAKLDYMESTVNMFKHQIMSSIESEDMLEKLETAVNEASALDAVLHERRRGRVRM